MNNVITNNISKLLSDTNHLVVREYLTEEGEVMFKAWHSGTGEVDHSGFGENLEDISTNMVEWFEQNIKEKNNL